MDEAFSVQTARSIQQNGVPRLETGEVITSWLPAHYLMAGSMSLFKDMHLAARLPFTVAGTIVIVLVGYAAYLITGSRIAGVLAAFLVAFSVPDIAWSRQARGYSLLQMFGMAAVVLSLLDVKRHIILCWFMISTMLVLAICTHRAGYVYWLMCAGILALKRGSLWYKNNFHLDAHSSILMSGFILLPVFIGILLPSSSSQGLLNTLSSLNNQYNRYSYAMQYINLIYDIWRLNVLWMAVGAVLMVINDWRKTLPIVVATLAYLYVLSEKNMCFNVRYLMPIVPLLHLAVACSLGLIAAWVSNNCSSRRRQVAIIAGLLVVWGSTSVTQNLTFRLGDDYELGPTEPQANWREALNWLGKYDSYPVTIMALPVFHDLYLGSCNGIKYFLPFTFSRIPGDWQESASYTVADTIVNAGDLQKISGYVVLDAFSYYNLKDEGIRKMLAQYQPIYETGDGTIKVWHTPFNAFR